MHPIKANKTDIQTIFVKQNLYLKTTAKTNNKSIHLHYQLIFDLKTIAVALNSLVLSFAHKSFPDEIFCPIT